MNHKWLNFKLFNLVYTMITGASGGIGKAMAMECARKGFNLLLVALDDENLRDVACYIRKEYSVQCDTLCIDLSEVCAGRRVYEWTREKQYKVNMLINNVGLGSKGGFHEADPAFYFTQINLNVTTTCLLTRLFLADLKANGPSHVMNVGSMGGFFIIPDKTVYSATKAFVYSFSRSLQVELKNTGVKVSVLCPGGTDSNHKTIAINKDLKGFARLSILSAEEVAREGIAGMLKGDTVIIPGFFNKCYYAISQIIPKFIANFIISNTFKKVHGHKY